MPEPIPYNICPKRSDDLLLPRSTFRQHLPMPRSGRTSTDICTHCQCPCKNREIHTCRCCQSLDNRDHGCGKWNIIYKCTCDRGYPDNNGYHYLGISMAYLPDKSGCQFQNTGLLQTADYNKQTNKEKDRLIIYIF